MTSASKLNIIEPYRQPPILQHTSKMPFSRRFSIISELTHIEVIARGSGVDVRHFLNRTYGIGRWRKLKGRAWVQYEDGRTVYAEIHWFEAHGIGKVNLKIVREFKSEA